MNSKRTIETFFRSALLRFAAFSIVSVVMVLFLASYLLTREQATADLRDTALATAQAFKDRIIAGDIRSVEAQIHDVLMLKEHEVAKVLSANHAVIYSPVGVEQSVSLCARVGEACLNGFWGSEARIEVPIFMDPTGQEAFRYLYLSKSISLNWAFLGTVFLVFLIGYGALIFAFIRVSRSASQRLGEEIATWSDGIKKNPKLSIPNVEAPFQELQPLKEALNGLNDQIEAFERKATDKARLLLLRGIAHDLLTPVAQLQFNLATLKLKLNSDEHEELLTEIGQSLKRVAGIASQVKSLKDSESVDGTELVRAIEVEVGVLRESKPLAQKQIRLELIKTTDALHSPFSPTDVARILGNLVQNAVDASTDGGVIQISVGEENKQGVLSVTDAGKGIPISVQSKVFEPEFTLKPGTGTGLGLAIVKYICDLRAANIELKSEVNCGTKISIRFPMVRGLHV